MTTIIRYEDYFSELKPKRSFAQDVVRDFLKSLRISESRRKFKRKILEDFLEFIERTESLPSGSKWDIRESERLLDEDGVLLGRCPITSVPFFDYLSEKDKVVSESRYNQLVYTLRQFGDFLADEGILLENPAYDLVPKAIQSNDMSMKRLSLSEAIEILAAAYNQNQHRVRNFTLVLMLLTSATRIGEINYMKESDFFEENGVMYCYGKSGRRIRFSTPGLSLCKQRLVEDNERKKALEGCQERYLFYSEKGGPLTTEEANRMLKDLAERAGITRDITVYWLRRTFATLLAEAGLSIRTIQLIFDHDKLQTTEKYIAEYLRYGLRPLLDNSTVHQCYIDVGRKFTLVRSNL